MTLGPDLRTGLFFILRNMLTYAFMLVMIMTTFWAMHCIKLPSCKFMPVDMRITDSFMDRPPFTGLHAEPELDHC